MTHRIFISALAVFLYSCGAGKPSSKGDHIMVSILPQKYFVKRIAGDNVKVEAMVLPGQSPATYDPTPKQMASLARTALYVRTGVPFEEAWMGKITDVNPGIKIVDLREGISLREMSRFEEIALNEDHHEGEEHEESDHSAHHHHEGEEHEESDHSAHHHEGKDPHIWLSPLLVKTQAQTLCKALIELNPSSKEIYLKRLEEFLRDLDELSRWAKILLMPIENRTMMVFHPSWGYFAEEFGLQQIPIEVKGKEPSASSLAALLDTAKKKGVRAIFVQSQFSQKAAETIARGIGAKLVPLDPLAEDYDNNFKRVVQTIADHLQ